jgi:hypothetical protein
MVLSDGQLHDGICIGCAQVDIREQLCSGCTAAPCALVSCSTSALLQDEWGSLQAVASLSLRLLDLGPSVLPHLLAAPLQQVSQLCSVAARALTLVSLSVQLQMPVGEHEQHLNAASSERQSMSSACSDGRHAVASQTEGVVRLAAGQRLLQDVAVGPQPLELHQLPANALGHCLRPTTHTHGSPGEGACHIPSNSNSGMSALQPASGASASGRSLSWVPQPPPLFLSKA